MDNNEELQTTVDNEAQNTGENMGTAPENEEVNNQEVDSNKPNKEFTDEQQEHINSFVRDRIDRERKKILQRYNVSSKEELDALVGKSQGYDAIKERYGLIKDENGALKERLAVIENNINNDKLDDIKAYFKGKELDFNSENLKLEVERHPEWLNPTGETGKPQTTIEVLGNEQSTNIAKPDEKEIASKLFGLNKLL